MRCFDLPAGLLPCGFHFQIEQDVARWLEAVLGAAQVRSAEPWLPQLATGVALSELLAVIAPEHRLKVVHRGSVKVGDYRCRDNIAAFLRAVKPLVRVSTLFEVRAQVAARLACLRIHAGR